MDQNFANLVCNQNGFDSAEFYGFKAQYLKFMKENHQNIGYFEEIHGPDDGCGPDFTVGGAKCDENAKSVDDCEFIDYKLTGLSEENNLNGCNKYVKNVIIIYGCVLGNL